MDAPTGSFIAFATAPGSVAADGKGRNGIFTKHFLKHMQTPGLPLEMVLKKVRQGVLADTDRKQVPWSASSLTINFYFIMQPPVPGKPATAKPPRNSLENAPSNTILSTSICLKAKNAKQFWKT